MEKKRGREVWDHRGPHEINDGEIDGEIEFDDEVLEGFRDEDDGSVDDGDEEGGD